MHPGTTPPLRGLPSGQVGRWRLDRTTGALSWDAACRRLFGALPGEGVAEALARVVHPADRARATGAEAGLEEVALVRVRDAGGTDAPRYLLSRVTHTATGSLEDPGGWAAGVVLDVTASHRADQRAALALEAMTYAYLALDAEFRVTYMNPAAEALLARHYDQLVGQVIWEHFPFLAGTVLEESYRRAATTGEVTTFELPGATDGSWITSTVRPATEGIDVFLHDSSEQHHATEAQERLVVELDRQATHDPLTGLGNTVLLGRRAAGHLASSPAAEVALVSLDLDRFGPVNDALGRGAGDELLQEVAERLRDAAPHGALVVRTDGDEFAVLLFDVAAREVDAVATRLLAAVREPLDLSGRDVHVTASAGVAAGRPLPGEDVGDFLDDLVRDVDIARHAAKRAGRDRATWCDAALQADVASRAAVERDLRRALRFGRDQLQLHYQPSFSLATGAPSSVEALLRWYHPVRGAVPPTEVIPVAEDSGLIVPLGDWVVATATAQAARWREVPDFTTWFNVAPRQLVSGDVPAALEAALARTGLPPHRLGVEVTESVLADGSPAGAALAEVRALGVRIAIDDFGTGYSSLSRLLAFPADVVKIDRSFVTASGTPQGAAVVRGIVDLAHGLGASVIAEGVETWEQLEVLKATACDTVTGFLLGRPLPAEEQHLRRVRLSPPRDDDGGLSRRRRPARPRPARG